MKRAYIGKRVRRRVRLRDRFRCAYCQTQIKIVGDELQIEHIIPVSKNGSSDESNLCLSCSRCNNSKGVRLNGIDPISGKQRPLFHPRRDRRHDHFVWSESGETIIGKTPVGRVTIAQLNMNSQVIRASRLIWIAAGWHPPAD